VVERHPVRATRRMPLEVIGNRLLHTNKSTPRIYAPAAHYRSSQFRHCWGIAIPLPAPINSIPNEHPEKLTQPSQGFIKATWSQSQTPRLAAAIAPSPVPPYGESTVASASASSSSGISIALPTGLPLLARFSPW